MENNILFQNNVLYSSGSRVEFDNEIKETLVIEGIIIVRIKFTAAAKNCSNLYGVIGDKIAWRVQDVREYNPNFTPDSIVSIRVYEKNPDLIIANDFGGRRFLINPRSGKIEGMESWAK